MQDSYSLINSFRPLLFSNIPPSLEQYDNASDIWRVELPMYEASGGMLLRNLSKE